jgi:ABC transporter DrrB family efflux protein
MTTLRWTLADGWAVTQRGLAHWARQPFVVALGLLFPLMITLMFGYLFGGAMSVPGGGYFEYLMPGMFALTMLFGIESTSIAMTSDASKGVTDRFRSMPMSPSAVVVGRCGTDMVYSAAGLAVLIGAGLLVGWRAHGSVAGSAAAVGLLLLLRFAFLWVGIFLGLVIRNPEAVVAVQVLVWPVGFLSNAFVAPETMPGWLGTVAGWNPISATAAATRELFGNPGWGGDSWPARHALAMSVGWPVLLSAVFLPLSVWRYRRLSR